MGSDGAASTSASLAIQAEAEPAIDGLSKRFYKAAVIHRKGAWRNFEAVEFATLEWVDWFNRRRLLEPIGNIPTAEADSRPCASIDQTAIAA